MPRRPYARTGLNALKARVKVRGLQAIDRRTSAARALLDWRKNLLDDLGGGVTVSAQRMALVEAAVRTRLYVDHVDAWIMERGSLINAKRRSVYPIIRERQHLVDSLARLLCALGLDRQGRPPIDLSQYLAQRQPSASAPHAAPTEGAPHVDDDVRETGREHDPDGPTGP
jgi:hypothetical protein